jgi:outer membrane protein TolC
MNIKIIKILFLALMAAPASSVEAQERPISLAEAKSEARRGSHDVQAARARAEAARHAERAVGSFRMPTLGLEVGAVRSNDPVAAFGGRLRQGRFTEQDFDPARLNQPDALTDWSGAVGAGWTPLDLSAASALSAAEAEADAAGLGAEWAERAASFRAEARYLDAVGAERRLRAADAALAAAEEVSRLVGLRTGEGLLTEADLLQSRAALEAARAARIDAQRALDDARDRLAVALGWPEGMLPVPTDTVFADQALPGEADLAARADLRASAQLLGAASARVTQARRARLPRVEGFARIETHSAELLSGAQRDWTVGIQVRVPLFTGFAVTARTQAATAMRRAAEQEHEGRLRAAAAELGEARRAVEAARQGSQAANAAAEAAEEAGRLMRRRFEEGLTTTADLLGAEAQAAALRARSINAGLALQIMAARLAFLTDTTPDDLPGGMDR